MLKRAFLSGAVLWVTLGVTQAQNTNQPANLTVDPTQSPEVLQLLDSTGQKVPLGEVFPDKHWWSPYNPNGIDVRSMGMKAGGVFDNSPLVDALMDFINPNNSQSGQNNLYFPAIPGQRYTDYYFSQSLHFYKPAHIICQGLPDGGGDSSVRLVFPAGMHGVIFDDYVSSPFQNVKGMAQGGMTGCGIVSKGFHYYWDAKSGDTTFVAPVDFYFQTWDFKVGDSIAPFQFKSPAGAPRVPPGTVVTAVDPVARTITINNPLSFTYEQCCKYGFWRLPVEKAFTVNTTAGSPNITITGGPSKLVSGDVIWSDAFPFGTTVLTFDGTAGSQNISTGPYDMNYSTPIPATKTETGGHLWLLGAAFKAQVGFTLRNNFFSTFPWGLQMMCSDWGTTKAGCNGSLTEKNIFSFSMIGRFVQGDNAGASASIMNVYSGNTIADIGEFGSVGSNYYADNANSSEASSSENGIIGDCVNSNSTSFFGGYAPNDTGYCTTGLGLPTTPGGAVVFWNPIAGMPTGAPASFNGNFYNPWGFFGPDGIQVCMNQPSAAFVFSHGSSGCGGGGNIWQLVYSSVFGTWELLYFGFTGGHPMWLTEGYYGNYQGYQAGVSAMINFPQGFLLNDHALGGGGIGQERLFDEGFGVPTESWHKQGDVHFNQGPVAGSDAGWINTADGAGNYKGFGHIQTDPPTAVSGGCGATLGLLTHGGDAFTINTGSGACTPYIHVTMTPPYGINGWACYTNDLSDDATARTAMLGNAGNIYYGFIDIAHYSVGATPAAVNFAPNSVITVNCTTL